MKTEDFLSLVQRYVDAWTRHDMAALDSLYAQDAVRYRFGDRLGGKREIQLDRRALWRAFPDMTMRYQDLFVSGTHGVVLWTIQGTQSSTFETSLGAILATGKRVEFKGVTVWEFDDRGLIVRENLYPDRLSLFQQLDAIRTNFPVPLELAA